MRRLDEPVKSIGAGGLHTIQRSNHCHRVLFLSECLVSEILSICFCKPASSIVSSVLNVMMPQWGMIDIL